MLLLVVTAVVFLLGIRSDPDYGSSYDGQDPNASGCVDAAVTAPIAGTDGPRLKDFDGRAIGHLELRASPKCGTIWAKVILDGSAAPKLTGRLLRMEMFRPGDDVRASYPLRLKGGREGFSNMLSAVDSCVRAEVFFIDGRRRGPKAVTACMLESD